MTHQVVTVLSDHMTMEPMMRIASHVLHSAIPALVMPLIVDHVLVIGLILTFVNALLTLWSSIQRYVLHVIQSVIRV